MSVSYWLDQSNGKVKTYDIAIVGAGIAGFSVAYWLKKEDPNMKIAIIDKGTIGSGATGRNAGFITCGSVEHFNRLCERWGKKTALEMWRFSEVNLALLKEHIIQDDKHLEFDNSGTFSLASTQEEFHELKETMTLMQSMDISVEALEQNAIEKRLGVAEFVGGIKYTQDASIHPVRLLNKMKSLLDVDVIEFAEVYDIETLSTGSVLLKTQSAHIEASVAVLTMNGYSSDLKKYFADKIYPTRGQIMVTEPVPRFMEGPCYANFVLDYFRQLQDGRVLIGGFRQLEKATEVGFSEHTTDVIQSSLYEFLQKHIPVLKNKKVTHRWAGVMGFSFDGQPLIGALPDQPQVYFAGGFTGHGIGLAFHSGKALVDLMYDRVIPDFISAKRI
ncbi:MAG: FAD-binding oxidoreductase [Bdellovibrionales bacterium]|nr:FAD-binding oxidoreductase [Bdellovibrionales bacterium]